MIRQKRLLLLFAWLLFLIGSFQKLRAQEWPPLASKEWIREHLNPEKPRLIFTRAAERQLREKLGSDSLVAELYAHIKAYADELLNLPPLTYQKRGRRLLRVSRDAISRTLALAMAYRIEGNISYRQRLEAELANISTFPDWNPAHFLDAAEMAVAVSLPLDWCGADLSPAVRSLARSALVEKALKPGLGVTEMNWWWDAVHNWNLVCHGGLAIAALVLFEEEPDLASHTLHRTVTKFPLGFSPYEPDGAYTEGPSYWFYATDYLTLAISAFESALGADFGFTNAPGIKESALFSEIAAGPSGDYYNYFDASTGGYHSLSHLGLLTWFAPRTGFTAPRQAWKKAIADEAEEHFKKARFSTLYLLALATQPEGLPEIGRPTAWLARGDSPVGILSSRDKNGLYLAAKGGSASDNHANMDAGSFILEWKRIRWSIDPGNQDYEPLEQTIGVGELWNRSQDSERWSLLTKNNYGHSTLTANGEKHLAAARALLTGHNLEAGRPYFSFGLTPLFGGRVAKAIRTFQQTAENTLQIRDSLALADDVKLITWQWITRADVGINGNTIHLSQDGERLKLKVVSPATFEVRVVSLDPPPLAYDKAISGLKRIEITVAPSAFTNGTGEIVVEVIGY
ncbi:MAG: heparinase II/III family protein [Lewinellaceae bacterium]|nr:heparinase II/III family protein [Lewinellaceae bacterium]